MPTTEVQPEPGSNSSQSTMPIIVPADFPSPALHMNLQPMTSENSAGPKLPITWVQPEPGLHYGQPAMPVVVQVVVPNPAASPSAKTIPSAVVPIRVAPANKKQRLEVQKILDLLEPGVCPKNVIIVLEICSGSGSFLFIWPLTGSTLFQWTMTGTRTDAESPQ